MQTRPGISLLEVIVAMAIFFVALIGIGQLITMSADRARDVQQRAQAIQLCQSKLAEVVSGVVPPGASQSNTPFDEDPSWEWSMDSTQGSVPNLWSVTVHVSRQRPDGSRVETSLSQMILEPTIRGYVGNTPTTLSSSSSSSGSSGSSSGSTSSGSGAAPAAGGSMSMSGAKSGSSGSGAAPAAGGSMSGSSSAGAGGKSSAGAGSSSAGGKSSAGTGVSSSSSGSSKGGK